MERPQDKNKENTFETTLAKLRKTEFQQKAILNNIPDIAWLKDTQGRFIAVNEPFARACGFKMEEIIGKTDLEVWPREMALNYQADDREVINSKKRKCVQEKILFCDTGEQWIETIKTPFFDDHGKVLGTTGIARNITYFKSETEKLEANRAELALRVKVRTAELTSVNEELRKEIKERIRAEESLLNTNSFLNSIFGSIQDGLTVMDTDLNILRVNPAKEKNHADSMPLVGKKCYQVYHNRNKPCNICPIQETIKTHKAAYAVSPLEDKEHKVIGYFDLYSFPMFDEKTGKLIGVIEYARDITKQKAMQETLKQSEEKFKNIFENSNVGILVLDIQNWNFILSNKTVQKMLGYTAEELEKLSVQDVHNKEDIPDMLQDLERMKKGEDTVMEKVLAVIRKDRSVFYAHIRTTKMVLGGRTCLMGTFQDVTSQKENTEKLVLAEKRYRLIAEQIGQLVYDIDLSNNEITWSGQVKKITGYDKEDFKRIDLKFWQGMICPEDRERVKTDYLRNIESGNPYTMEYRFLRKDGIRILLRNRAMFLKDAAGKPCRIIGCIEDITQARENENELNAYREKLEVLVNERTKLLEEEVSCRKEAEEKLRSLQRQIEFMMEVTKTGFDIIDEDLNLRYVDPARVRIFGDYANRKCFEYFYGYKTCCPDCSVMEALKTKKVVVREKILKKENNRPVQITTIPYQDPDGHWLVAEVSVDMTQKKKSEEELRKYRNELEKLVDERTRDLLEETNRYKNAEREKSKLNRELIRINEKLKSVSLIDAHTGLYNYRYLQEAMEMEFHQARRYAQNLAVIMLDVDYFKSINDVYGIAFGDLVLKQLAKQLKRMVRRYDILIRYSGEEFIIISPRLNRNAAFSLAQRLLNSLNIINFGNRKHSVKLKISLSVVSFPEDRAKNGMDLVSLADTLLNKAKEDGGNRAFSSLDLKNRSEKKPGKIFKAIGISGLKKKIDKLNKQSKQGLSESIFAFAKTLELKDHYTGEHVENTVQFATAVANQLNLPKEEVELIKQAAMLHDLGKIGVSENILLKKGKLNKKEFEEIKKHPQIGADIIRPIQFLHDLIPFIFYHHERWDGKGYPSGIKGEDIPLGARVIAIADVYQALISDRPYHKAFPRNVAIEMIRKSSGTQFDPRVVNAFLKIVKKKINR
ncbi:MAG: PAS domain S-box protein [Candidatus Omnitrophica bacterium]|jgi:diguanylate cyclase (GGDEF)-like protein/PAS domain S-box-containing protein|nr:PAS domain S-box protein [Candidatus Omnitrophota bacterium]